MNRDPNYYLQKANFFYKRSRQDYLNDFDPNNFVSDSDDDFEYAYDDSDTARPMEIEPVVSEEIIVTDLGIKPQYKRIYDPITKHYYKVDKIFENASIAMPRSVEINAEVWYPENKLGYKTIFDPKSKRYFRVNKKYNDNGKYRITYNKLTRQMMKPPGTSYYRPTYQIN